MNNNLDNHRQKETEKYENNKPAMQIITVVINEISTGRMTMEQINAVPRGKTIHKANRTSKFATAVAFCNYL